MFNFNLKTTDIYRAVKWERIPVFRFAGVLKKLFLILFVFIFLAFLYGFLPENFSKETSRSLLGFSVIFLVLAVSFWEKESFLNSKLKRPRLKAGLSEVVLNPDKFNLAEFLSFEVAKAVSKSIRFVHSLEITPTLLLYFLLKDNPQVNFVFLRALLDLKKIKKTLKKKIKSLPVLKKDKSLISKNFQDTIFEALKTAQKRNHLRVEIGDVIPALAKYEPVFKKNLVDSKLRAEDIENLTWWWEKIKEESVRRKKFWEYENLARKGGLAKGWTAGYTVTLDKYSVDWTEVVRKRIPEIIGHTEEIEITERILSRREVNNVLIVGEPGTGRKSIIYALAKKALLGQSLPEVNYKRVVELDLVSLLAEIEEMEKVEAVLDEIFQEIVKAGNIILVISEFHNYIGQTSRPGVIDISGIISPYLQLPQFQIVAITTYGGFHRHIERNPSILSLFEKVEVSQIAPRETLMLLENLALVLERKYKKFISYPAIKEIISLTDRYLPSLPFPEKAMDLLDEIVIYVASSTKDKIVLPKHVAKVITEKIEIPVGEIEAKEKEILLNLEELIHQRIINQDEAVKEVSSALRRARAEVTVRKGPMGTFLFLGPTGVGKTETSKALAEVYFGSEKKIIRLDMSEFQDTKDISRLIGSVQETGLLTGSVKENPFSLILLDEIEKAHPNILNLFLQVLDEGHLTDGMGRKVSFRNTIIIATSNAGYKVILKAIKEKVEWLGVKRNLLDYLFEKRIFRPEFINRFDAVVVFKPLTKENLLDIAELMLQKLKKNLEKKGVDFIITGPLKEKIVDLSYSPVFGAREMRRVIQDKVENLFAAALLSGELKRGSKVEVEPKKLKLVIKTGK